MAKQTGLGMRCSVAGVDLSGDIGSLSRIGGGPATLDVTGINSSAYERIGGQRDGAIEYVAFFNPAAGQAHVNLSTLPTADQIVTVHTATAIGSPLASTVAKQINYDPTRGNDGAFTFAVQALANGYGLEWGVGLTAWQRTDTAATNGASIDDAAATAFGAQAWLHLYTLTGTDVTVKVQDSADNSSFADVTGLTFTAVTAAPASQRLATASGATIRRYLRAVTTTSAGFTSAVFSVQVTRNTVATVF